MTIDAGGHSILYELVAVNVGMAILTLGRRRGEVCSDEPGLQVGRLVAIDAGGGLVRAHQWE